MLRKKYFAALTFNQIFIPKIFSFVKKYLDLMNFVENFNFTSTWASIETNFGMKIWLNGSAAKISFPFFC